MQATIFIDPQTVNKSIPLKEIKSFFEKTLEAHFIAQGRTAAIV